MIHAGQHAPLQDDRDEKKFEEIEALSTELGPILGGV